MSTATLLAEAAAVLGTRRFSDMAEKLSAAAGILGAKAMDTRISNLHDAAELLSIAFCPQQKGTAGTGEISPQPGLSAGRLIGIRDSKDSRSQRWFPGAE